VFALGTRLNWPLHLGRRGRQSDRMDRQGLPEQDLLLGLSGVDHPEEVLPQLLQFLFQPNSLHQPLPPNPNCRRLGLIKLPEFEAEWEELEYSKRLLASSGETRHGRAWDEWGCIWI